MHNSASDEARGEQCTSKEDWLKHTETDQVKQVDEIIWTSALVVESSLENDDVWTTEYMMPSESKGHNREFCQMFESLTCTMSYFSMVEDIRWQKNIYLNFVVYLFIFKKENIGMFCLNKVYI